MKRFPSINNTVLVSAFPGTGKSYYCSNGNWSQYVPEKWCTDSDSSKFDKSDFPANYIEHIKEKVVQGYGRVFISSHKDVREALVINDLPFVLAYPARSLKYEYLERYRKRGSTDKFIALVNDNWDEWIDGCQAQENCYHIELSSGEYLSNVV